MATIKATSMRKTALEKVPLESTAQARNARLVSGGEASV